MQLRKQVTLTLLLLLSSSQLALAANPFADVPKGHWAYDSVAKLTEAGVIQGYPDSTFRGDRTITRYEMAQLVAKALAKNAISQDDALVQEFAPELKNLGIRVSALEEKSDNVTITGSVKVDYRHTTKREPHDTIPGRHKHHRAYHSNLTSRLNITGKINPNWTYTGQIKNKQKLVDENGNSSTHISQAYLTGTYDTTCLTLGRYGTMLGGGNIYDDFVDGIRITSGKCLTFTAEVGKMSNGEPDHLAPPPPPPSPIRGKDTIDRTHHHSSAGKFYRLGLSGKIGQFTLDGDYVKVKDVHSMGMKETTDSIYSLGAAYQLSKLNLGCRYLHGNNATVKDADGSEKGYALNLSYGQLDPKITHSFNFFSHYYDQGASTTIAHTMLGPFDHFPIEGFKGFDFGAMYVPLQNIQASIAYSELQGKKSSKKAHTIWSQLAFFF